MTPLSSYHRGAQRVRAPGVWVGHRTKRNGMLSSTTIRAQVDIGHSTHARQMAFSQDQGVASLLRGSSSVSRKDWHHRLATHAGDVPGVGRYRASERTCEEEGQGARGSRATIGGGYEATGRWGWGIGEGGLPTGVATWCRLRQCTSRTTHAERPSERVDS